MIPVDAYMANKGGVKACIAFRGMEDPVGPIYFHEIFGNIVSCATPAEPDGVRDCDPAPLVRPRRRRLLPAGRASVRLERLLDYLLTGQSVTARQAQLILGGVAPANYFNRIRAAGYALALSKGHAQRESTWALVIKDDR